MVKNCFKIVLGVKKEFVIPQLLIRKALIELQLDDEVVTREITDLYFDIWSLNDDNSYQIDLYLVDNNELSIGYLLDEDFEIKDIKLDIAVQNDKEFQPIAYNIINYECFIEIDNKANHLLNFLNGVYLDETVSYVGHNAKAMYGYKMETPAYKYLAKDLADKFERYILDEGVTHFVFGTTLGGDIAGFFSAQYLKRKYPNLKIVLLLPYKKVDEKWYGEHKERFSRMLDLADIVIEVDLLKIQINKKRVRLAERIKPTGEYDVYKIFQLLDFLVDMSNKILIHDNPIHYEKREHFVIQQANFKEIPVVYI